MEEDDIAKQHEFNQDIELYGLDCEHPHISSLKQAQEFCEERTKSNINIAAFAIETEGKYIGFCSLMHLQARFGNLELGIMIGDREYWGQGYGKEVTKLLLDFGFHYLGGRRIALTTHAKNERAIGCYGTCGFVEEGRLRKVIWIEGEFIDLVKMSILREEWESK